MDWRYPRGGGPPRQSVIDTSPPMPKRFRQNEPAYGEWDVPSFPPLQTRGRGFRGQSGIHRGRGRSIPPGVASFNTGFGSNEPPSSAYNTDDPNIYSENLEVQSQSVAVSVDYHHGQGYPSLDTSESEAPPLKKIAQLRTRLESRIEESKAFISSLIQFKHAITEVDEGNLQAETDESSFSGPDFSESQIQPLMQHWGGQGNIPAPTFSQRARRGGPEVGWGGFHGGKRGGRPAQVATHSGVPIRGRSVYNSMHQGPSRGRGAGYGHPSVASGRGRFHAGSSAGMPPGGSAVDQDSFGPPKKGSVPFAIAFKNLCSRVVQARVKQVPPAVFEVMLEEMDLWSAFVFKRLLKIGENGHCIYSCDIYINNVHLGTGQHLNRNMAKNKAYNEAYEVIRKKSPESIMISHPRANLEVLKNEADIIESPVLSSESNYSNVRVPNETPKLLPLKKFVILEPCSIKEGTGMAATCILRQSADFSHMFLMYTFKPGYQDQKGLFCTLYIEDQNMGTAFGVNKSAAKSAISTKVMKKLQETNYTIQIKPTLKVELVCEDLIEVFGRLTSEDQRDHYEEQLVSYFNGCFNNDGEKIVMAIPVADLTQSERDAIFSAGKKAKLVAEVRLLTGVTSEGKPKYTKPKRGEITSPEKQYLIMNRKLSCTELLEFLISNGGESYRYRLKGHVH